jgi:hypothetical protein
MWTWVCAARIPGTNTGDFNELARRLTERDFEVIDALARHRVMTAAMIEVLFFPSPHAASIRLLTLHELGILERYRSPASRAYRYVLGWRGQCVHAARHGEKPPTRQAGTWKAQQNFLSGQRPHLEGVNAFFCRLQYAARADGGVRLAEWRAESERSDFIYRRPDGTGRLDWNDGRSLYFYLEHDRSTETLERLVGKVTGYKASFERDSEPKGALLIEVISERRLNNFLPRAEEAWRDDNKGRERRTALTIAVSAVSEGERTFTRPADHPDAITGRRWHVLGRPGLFALADLPEVIPTNWR